MQPCPAPTVCGEACCINLNGPLKRYERRLRILYFRQQLYEVAKQGYLGRYPNKQTKSSTRSWDACNPAKTRQNPLGQFRLPASCNQNSWSALDSQTIACAKHWHENSNSRDCTSRPFFSEFASACWITNLHLALEVPLPFQRLAENLWREWRHAWAVCRFVCSS